jgi:hypothetical protein
MQPLACHFFVQSFSPTPHRRFVGTSPPLRGTALIETTSTPPASSPIQEQRRRMFQCTAAFFHRLAPAAQAKPVRRLLGRELRRKPARPHSSRRSRPSQMSALDRWHYGGCGPPQKRVFFRNKMEPDTAAHTTITSVTWRMSPAVGVRRHIWRRDHRARARLCGPPAPAAWLEHFPQRRDRPRVLAHVLAE